MKYWRAYEYSLYFLTFLNICVLIFLGFIFTDINSLCKINVPVFEQDYETTVLCGSDSMGLIFGCNTTIKGDYYYVGDDLEIGGIYTYYSDPERTKAYIHRLIFVFDGGEFVLMKGDNNYYPEIVSTKDIIARVYELDYRGQEFGY